MPKYVIEEILSINRHCIRNWKYRLPNNRSSVLELPLKLQSTPLELVQKIVAFLDVELDNNKLEKILQFAEQYKQLNQY
jgi:hypothetical protein